MSDQYPTDPQGQPTQNPLIVNGHTYQKAGREAYNAGRGFGWDYTQGHSDCQPPGLPS